MIRALATLDDVDVDVVIDRDAGFGTLKTERGCLPLVAMDVRTRISDLTAETTIRQTFRNALDEPLEATYIFPLPDRAAVTRFQMYVAGRTIEGQLKERAEARQEYDQAIRQGHRAAIAEEERSGVFNLRVGNLPPQEEATVELTLVGPLPVSDGEATFRFPLVVAPRYTPGVPLDGPSVGAGVTPDTDEVPDASRVTPPVLLPGFPNPVRLSLEVQLEPIAVGSSPAKWRKQLRTSLHSTIVDEGPPWTVRLQPGERLNRDFILRFPVAAGSIATSLRASPATDGKPGVFALTLLPPAIRDVKPKPREIVFVLDRSGSMGGWKMVAARRAVGRMIDTLLDQDRFAVLAFDDAIDRPPHAKDGFLPGTNQQRWRMLEWLGSIDARGGTEMGAALQEAMRLFAEDSGDRASPGEPAAPRQRILVTVTDGQVTGEDAILRRLAKASDEVAPRIFTVGIDRAVNAGFLRRLADLGLGDCELVESEDRLDEAMDRIHRLIGTPVLTQVRVEPLNAKWLADSLAPGRWPDLFVDRPVTVYGRHHSRDGTVRLRVRAVDAAGNPWQEEVRGRPAPAEVLTSIWGRAKLRDLEDQYASGQTRDATKLMQEIVAVSLESHVLSRFTAYVAVDRSEVVNQGGQQQRIVQPVEMPDGWEMPRERLGAFAGVLGAASPVLGAKMMRTRLAKIAPAAAVPPDAMLLQLPETGMVFCDTASHEAFPLAMASPPAICVSGVDEEKPRPLEAPDIASLPILRLLQRMIAEAVQLQASEIHIEPLADRIRVQFRIADQFVDRDSLPLRLLGAIVGQVRKLANLNVAEADQPQQGRMRIKVGSREVLLDVRITASAHGEAVVMTFATAPAAGDGDTRTDARVATDRERFWA
jgi:Ca-activated chloride channel family protein